MAWYYEGAIAERLGLTRSALEDYRARSLKKNGDWKKIGRSVALSEDSLKKLLAYLGASNFDCSACLVEKNGPVPPEVVELVVTRVYPNPRLILAAFLDDA